MPLNAELTTRLDANALVQGFLGGLGGPAGSLNAIPNPADPGRLAAAGGAGGAFLPTPILDAVNRFAAVALPPSQVPDTIQLVERTLVSIEHFTARDQASDLAALAQQLTAELEKANQQGIPGTILTIADLLKNSPTGSSLRPLLSSLLGGGRGLALPDALGEYLPAFASTIRVIAGLMVYETVLAEGERLSGIVSSLFSASRAQSAVDSLQAAFSFGGQNLAQALAAADPNDSARVHGLINAVENAAAQLDDLDAYVSRGMGFGEATLVHFNSTAAQAEIATAGALLRDANLGSLRRTIESLVHVVQPIADGLNPGAAAASGMDQLLQLAEAQVDQAAAAIRNLDAGVLVTPLTTGISAITAPLRDFTNL